MPKNPYGSDGEQGFQKDSQGERKKVRRKYLTKANYRKYNN